MTTLIEIRTTSGCKGRCDAKCYDAEHDDCQCICGGYNHGKGIETAKENIRKWSEVMIEDYAAKFDIYDYETLVNINVVNQMILPFIDKE
jgi:predicted RNase H-like HicB family nuclease